MRETLERSGSSWHPSRREMLGALGVGLLAPRIARAATFALVDHCSTKIQNGIGGTNTINSTGADLLICAICTDQTSGAAFYSDSKGNTGWTLLFDQTCGWSGRIRLYYCIPTSVGSGHYLSISGSYVCSVFFSGFSGAPGVPYGAQVNLTIANDTFYGAGDNYSTFLAVQSASNTVAGTWSLVSA